MQHTGKHGAGEVAERSTSRFSSKESNTGLSFWNIKAHPLGHTCSNKATPTLQGHVSNNASPYESMRPFCLNLWRPCACCHSMFMWVHMCVIPAMSARHYFPGVIQSLWFLTIFLSPLCIISWATRGGVWWPSVPKSHTLCTLTILYSLPSTAGQSLYDDAWVRLIHEHSRMPLEVILSPCYFNRMIRFDFP